MNDHMGHHAMMGNDMDPGMMGNPDMGGGGGGMDMGGDDKPLTSQFRGVCWNKKNRR